MISKHHSTSVPSKTSDIVRYRIIEGRLAEIEAIFLSEKGTGRGTNLVDRIGREAYEAGCGAIIVGWNTNPNFWSTLGFEPLSTDPLYFDMAREEGVRLVEKEDGLGEPVLKYLFRSMD